ncbi:MAG TPA: AI-2E family transporter [Xanthobacteraceae bacterium]|jgi:predicted PurR-regulated permease PerM|nr:AI-2E family transporter [Xanthobacteraceae bacterium]
MIHQRHLTFWIVTLVVFAFLLWLLSDILLPFVAGLALAYLQTPLADRMERLGMNRTLAALLIVGFVVLTFILLALLLVPILAEQAAALIGGIPSYVARLQALLSDPGPPWLRQLLNGGDAGKTMSQVMTQGAGYMTTLMQSVWAGGKAIASFISVLVIMPVVTFYLICDWHKMVAILDGWVPPQNRETVHKLVGEIDAAVSGFLRGQAGVCLVVGIYYAVALSLIGLNFGLLIGLTAGVLTFMPYIGSTAGLLIAASVALGQFWPNWILIAAVIGIFLVGQFIEGNVLGPKLVGDRVGLHPVWLIFAMFAFGYLLGFVGLLIAVPLAAAIGVLFRFGLSRYFASPFYLDEESG